MFDTFNNENVTFFAAFQFKLFSFLFSFVLNGKATLNECVYKHTHSGARETL